MPGIVGIIGKGLPGENAPLLQRMVKPMMYELFYVSDTYVNEQLGLWIGWVTHEGSFSDCMPIWNETKNVFLIFAGEDFTEQSEIEQLRINGHDCDLETASYLVHLYEERGVGFIEELNGWFSGVLVDLHLKRIILFNDRYGLGRIYFHEDANRLYFSSEAKSLLKVLPGLRELDLNSLAEIFSCGCVLQNKTLFRGVGLLPAASRWTFNTKPSSIKETYFSPKVWESQPLLAEKGCYEELKETFVRILPRYLRGKRQVGMSLTGGLDGRMIMSWANKPPGTLPCYSFGSLYRDCTDVRIARQVANVCGQSHETIRVDSEFLSEFKNLANKTVFVSDGTMDVSGSVELYVNGIARQIAPVRLTGNYGSEIVRGNIAFKPCSFNDNLINKEFSQLVRLAAETYESEYLVHKLSFIAFKQVPWHHYSRLSVEQSQLSMRSPYLDNELVSLMYRISPKMISSKDLSLRLIADGTPKLSEIPTDRGLRYHPLPLLSSIRHLYEEFTFRAEYAYDYGMPQWLTGIDDKLKLFHLEKLFLGRHKFYHFRVWYRDCLSSYVKEVLLDQRTMDRPYLNGQSLEKMVRKHIRGTQNYTTEIHKILTAELVQRQLIET